MSLLHPHHARNAHLCVYVSGILGHENIHKIGSAFSLEGSCSLCYWGPLAPGSLLLCAIYMFDDVRIVHKIIDRYNNQFLFGARVSLCTYIRHQITSNYSFKQLHPAGNRVSPVIHSPHSPISPISPPAFAQNRFSWTPPFAAGACEPRREFRERTKGDLQAVSKGQENLHVKNQQNVSSAAQNQDKESQKDGKEASSENKDIERKDSNYTSKNQQNVSSFVQNKDKESHKEGKEVSSENKDIERKDSNYTSKSQQNVSSAVQNKDKESHKEGKEVSSENKDTERKDSYYSSRKRDEGHERRRDERTRNSRREYGRPEKHRSSAYGSMHSPESKRLASKRYRLNSGSRSRWDRSRSRSDRSRSRSDRSRSRSDRSRSRSRERKLQRFSNSPKSSRLPASPARFRWNANLGRYVNSKNETSPKTARDKEKALIKDSDSKDKLYSPEDSFLITDDLNLSTNGSDDRQKDERTGTGPLTFKNDRGIDINKGILTSNIEKPVVEKPVIVKSGLQKPAVENLAFDKPATGEPVAARPVIDRAVIVESYAENPALVKQVAEKQVIEKPVVWKPAFHNPVIDKPVVQKPVIESCVEKAAVQKPVMNRPAEKLVIPKPVDGKPVFENSLTGKQDIEKRIVGKQAVENSIMERKVIENPIVQKQVMERQPEKPVIQKPVNKKLFFKNRGKRVFVIQNRVVEKQVVGKQAAEKPVMRRHIDKQAMKKSGNKKPVFEHSAVGKQVIGQQIVEKDVDGKPVIEKGAVSKPVTQTPVIEKPGTQKPVTGKPVFQKAENDKPVFGNPEIEKEAARKPVAKKRAARKQAKQEPVRQKTTNYKPALHPVTGMPVGDDVAVDKQRKPFLKQQFNQKKRSSSLTSSGSYKVEAHQRRSSGSSNSDLSLWLNEGNFEDMSNEGIKEELLSFKDIIQRQMSLEGLTGRKRKVARRTLWRRRAEFIQLCRQHRARQIFNRKTNSSNAKGNVFYQNNKGNYSKNKYKWESQEASRKRVEQSEARRKKKMNKKGNNSSQEISKIALEKSEASRSNELSKGEHARQEVSRIALEKSTENKNIELMKELIELEKTRDLLRAQLMTSEVNEGNELLRVDGTELERNKNGALPVAWLMKSIEKENNEGRIDVRGLEREMGEQIPNGLSTLPKQIKCEEQRMKIIEPERNVREESPIKEVKKEKIDQNEKQFSIPKAMEHIETGVENRELSTNLERSENKEAPSVNSIAVEKNQGQQSAKTTKKAKILLTKLEKQRNRRMKRQNWASDRIKKIEQRFQRDSSNITTVVKLIARKLPEHEETLGYALKQVLQEFSDECILDCKSIIAKAKLSPKKPTTNAEISGCVSK